VANTITTTVLLDGPRRATVQIDIVGDASGDEASTEVLDISAALAMGDRTEVKIDRIQAHLDNFGAILEWDATANVIAWALSAGGDSDMNFRSHGGIRNSSGAGKTGDIDLTTTDLGSEYGSIILHLVKVEGESVLR